jgi:hypothetical protein
VGTYEGSPEAFLEIKVSVNVTEAAEVRVGEIGAALPKGVPKTGATHGKLNRPRRNQMLKSKLRLSLCLNEVENVKALHGTIREKAVHGIPLIVLAQSGEREYQRPQPGAVNVADLLEIQDYTDLAGLIQGMDCVAQF